jgi:hypothetical protein
VSSGIQIRESETPLSRFAIANPKGDSVRLIVWLGRYALEKETRAPNAKLRRVRNPLQRVNNICLADCILKSVECREETRV